MALKPGQESSARAGLEPAGSARIVRLLAALNDGDTGQSSLRAGILIARVAAQRLRSGTLSDALLAQITADVLNGRGPVPSTGQIAKHLAKLE